jgi:hypothetical protein
MIGSIVTAKVIDCRKYGLFFNFNDKTILVKITDLSWFGSTNSERFAKIGDEKDVMIVAFNDLDNHYIGSIKGLEPSANPWAQDDLLFRGRVGIGCITNVMSYGCLILMNPGIHGFYKFAEKDRKYSLGETVIFKITYVDQALETVAVSLEQNNYGLKEIEEILLWNAYKNKDKNTLLKFATSADSKVNWLAVNVLRLADIIDEKVTSTLEFCLGSENLWVIERALFVINSKKINTKSIIKKKANLANHWWDPIAYKARINQ